MTDDLNYSNKDSNRNRFIEAKLHHRLIVLCITLLALLAGGYVYYTYQHKNIYQPPGARNGINPIKPLPPSEAPIAAKTKNADEAKPYDLSTAPYQQ